MTAPMREAPGMRTGAVGAHSSTEEDAVSERRPLVSVITVSLNAVAHVAEAVDSVLRQSFDDYEYVIVDGGSTDGTLDVLQDRQVRSGGRIRLWSGSDDGLYDAMNQGLRHAHGEFVLFLGADDRLMDGALAAVAPKLAASPPPHVLCGGSRVFGRGREWEELPRHVIRRGMPARAPARHQSILVLREAAVREGGFDQRYPIAADYDLYLRLVEAGARVVLTDTIISEFRLGGVSSKNAWATARDYRAVRVAHGANPVVESLVMVKSALAAELFALSRTFPEGRRDDDDER